MSDDLAPSLLSRFSEFLAEQMGLRFPPDRWPDLQRGLSAAAPELGFEDAAACAAGLLAEPLSRRQIETLATHLTIGETYFFRDKSGIEAFESHILPDLLQARRLSGERYLRFWSAGCCTGEEPYTLAILLRRMIPDIENWRITIRATDINPRFLQKARSGIYREWSFRDTPPWLKRDYFTSSGPRSYELKPHIRAMVNFSYLNLVEDVFPALNNDTNAMDVILCRNVLMYFTSEQVSKTIAHFHRALVDGGWFITSPSENANQYVTQLKTVNFPGAIVYRKSNPCAAGERSGKAAKTQRPAQRSHEPENSVSLLAARRALPSPALPLSLSPPSSLPSLPSPRRDLLKEAHKLYEAGCYSEAEARLEEAVLHDNAPQAWDLLARVHANQGRLAAARRCCERAIAHDKLNAAHHYLRATILQEQDEVDEAVASLKRALFLDPDFVMAHFTLGNIYRQRQRQREAAKSFANTRLLLQSYRPDAILPESEGVTASRLGAILEAGEEPGEAPKARDGVADKA